MESVRYENPRLSRIPIQQDVLEHGLADVGVKGREWVLKDEYPRFNKYRQKWKV
jgi:hypothetical protein